MIAALFVDGKGAYTNDPRFDAWPLERDARQYQGPFPVIAHPPCQLWGPMANVNFARYGGEHNRPGNDGGCFASALESVNKFGGVLEHPAFTRAWVAHGLIRPCLGIWIKCGDGWVTEVWQSAYGHRARKRTWLYCVSYHLPSLKWDKVNGTHQIGGHDQRGKEKNKPTISGKAASATPREFLEVLYQIAMGAP